MEDKVKEEQACIKLLFKNLKRQQQIANRKATHEMKQRKSTAEDRAETVQ